MAPIAVGGTQNGSVKGLETAGTNAILEIEDFEIFRFLDRPRPINIKTKRSLDERSFSELSIPSSSRIMDRLENVSPLGRMSGFDTPRSNSYIDSHPMVAYARGAGRRSLFYFVSS